MLQESPGMGCDILEAATNVLASAFVSGHNVSLSFFGFIIYSLLYPNSGFREVN